MHECPTQRGLWSCWKKNVFWLPTVWEWGNSLATTSGKDVELHHILSFSFVKSHSWRQSDYQHIHQDCQPDLWLLSVSKWGKGSLRPVRPLNAELITCTELILAAFWFRIVALLTFECSLQSCEGTKVIYSSTNLPYSVREEPPHHIKREQKTWWLLHDPSLGMEGTSGKRL